MKAEEALELREEVESLEKALDLCMHESDAKLRELATATGIPWGGKSHEEVVILVNTMREQWIQMRAALTVLRQWDMLNPPAPGSDMPWCRMVVDDGLRGIGP